MCLLSLLGSRPCVLEASLGGSRLEQSSEQVICCTNYFTGDAYFHFVFSGSKKGSLFGHHFSEEKGHLAIFLVLKHR